MSSTVSFRHLHFGLSRSLSFTFAPHSSATIRRFRLKRLVSQKHFNDTQASRSILASASQNMPIWGLKTVAQVIATGFEGPQHCDEPWPYQFASGQQVLVHVRGEGRNSIWLPARVIQPTRVKQYPTTTLQYWRVEYVDNGSRRIGEFSPQDGDVKPDCPYVRELIAEEIMWPIDDPSRSIPMPMSSGRSRVAC